MPLGEAIFTQRSIRRFKPDSIPLDDIQLILEAAAKAPNGGNQQVARFLVVNDPAMIREFGQLYQEAWWAKRGDEGFLGRQDLPRRYHPAAGLADAMQNVPCVMFALAMHDGSADSVIPAVQNLMLAARALGIGSVPTTLHPTVMPRFRAMFGVPEAVGFHFCVPLGYPQGNFGPNVRKPTS
jgi:nitroreductase